MTTIVESWLHRYDEPVRQLANELRMLVRTALPGCEEALRPGWGLIGYRTRTGSHGRYVGFVAPLEDCVFLGFEWGMLLDDGDQLLEPRGGQVSVYRAVPGEPFPVERLSDLLRQAAVLAEMPAEMRSQQLVRREA